MGQEGGQCDLKGATYIFLNRNGEKIDWENGDLSELEVVSE